MFAFQETDVYKMAKLLHLECKKITLRVINEKTTADQLRRASFSIPLNIAEGSGKFSNPDRRKFFIIARASVFECVAILDIMHDEEKISDADFDSIASICDEISRMLYKMIKNLE